MKFFEFFHLSTFLQNFYIFISLKFFPLINHFLSAMQLKYFFISLIYCTDTHSKVLRHSNFFTHIREVSTWSLHDFSATKFFFLASKKLSLLCVVSSWAFQSLFCCDPLSCSCSFIYMLENFIFLVNEGGK